MKKIKSIPFFVLILSACVLGCGPRQPAAKNEAPGLGAAESRTCPEPVLGPNVQLTNEIGESNAPVIVWDGTGFAVAWWDLRGSIPAVYSVRLDKDGVKRSAERRMTNTGISRDQSLAVDSKEVHLVWRDGEKIMSARLGVEEPVSKVLSPSGSMPAAGAWGAAVWVEKGRLFFRSDGMILAGGKELKEPEPEVVATGGIEDPQLAWNGEFYAAVWSASIKGGREIRFQRISRKGFKLEKPVVVSSTAGVSQKPVVVWTGESFVVAWTSAAPSEQNPRDRYRIFIAMVPAVGDAPTMTRQLEFNGSADQIALVSTGKELGMAWVGSRQDNGTAVYFQRLGFDGKLLGSTIEVTDRAQFITGRPNLAWGGDGYAVTWHDDRAQTGTELFFSFLKCGEEVEIQEPDAGAETSSPDAGAVSDTDTAAPELKDLFSDNESKK